VNGVAFPSSCQIRVFLIMNLPPGCRSDADPEKSIEKVENIDSETAIYGDCMDFTSCIYGMDLIDDSIPSIALRRPRVRIPPGPLETPRDGGFVLLGLYMGAFMVLGLRLWSIVCNRVQPYEVPNS
jgi:hypothetical protein